MMEEEAAGCFYWWLWYLASLRWTLNFARAAWIIVNNLYAIPSYFLWLGICLPILAVNGTLYWRIEEKLFGWMLSQVACWNYTAGYRLLESGSRLDDYEHNTVLFMPNHQSTADVPLCMSLLAARRNFGSRVMWVMDKVFKFTNFGCVSIIHDDFFILAGKENRAESLNMFRDHLRNAFIPKQRRYLVLFPEGGFLRKRKAASQRFAEKNNLPHLTNVTLPRTGALEVIMEVLGPRAATNGDVANHNSHPARQAPPRHHMIEKIVDVTIAYPDGRPLDLLQIFFAWRPACDTHVHYRVFDVADIPTDPEGLRSWMYNLYVEKEALLQEYYDTGLFPHGRWSSSSSAAAADGDSVDTRPREVLYDPVRFLFIHIFFIATFTVLCWGLSNAAELCSGPLAVVVGGVVR